MSKVIQSSIGLWDRGGSRRRTVPRRTSALRLSRLRSGGAAGRDLSRPAYFDGMNDNQSRRGCRRWPLLLGENTFAKTTELFPDLSHSIPCSAHPNFHKNRRNLMRFVARGSWRSLNFPAKFPDTREFKPEASLNQTASTATPTLRNDRTFLSLLKKTGSADI